ncbi:MAG: beta-N-acetylhexosaminidase family protein [Armatimonadota bacterium]
MHNSLFIRDLLQQTNQDPMRLERRDPHRTVARDPQAAAGEGEFTLDGAWSITGEGDPAVMRLLADDLADFFEHMEVAVSAESGQTVTFSLATDLAPRACRLTCHPGKITVEGGDVAGLWAGLTWLEWEMRTRRGPILPAGTITRQAAWPVQISQGPWGGNYSVPDFSSEYLSDDAFRLYAHYGVNSMMIYGDLLCYVQSAILPELNHPDAARHLAILQDAAVRAARYGVQFSYVVVGPKLRHDHPVFLNHPTVKGCGFDLGTGPGQAAEDAGETHDSGPLHFLCSSDPVSLSFYEETFTRLFTTAPQLAGVILIVASESFYHCRIWAHAKHRCARCDAHTTEEVLGNLTGVVQQAVSAAQPRAFTAVWAYSTWEWERPDRLELVRQLPNEVALYHQIEKDQHYQKDGYVKHIWDYSVDYIGPGENTRQLADAAHATGRPLFIKTETGIGLEVFQFPYVPAMQRLADKWQAVRSLQPAGVQQSWLFYGMFGSRAEELGLWAAYAPEMPRDVFLHRMAVRDFGPDLADAALISWEHMSRAVGHIPCVTLLYYYVGPSFLGPAHPIVPETGVAIPDDFYGYLFYLQELEESFSRRQIEDARSCLVMEPLPETAQAVWIQWEGPSDGWDIVVREYTRAAEEARQAWEILRDAAPLTRTEADRRQLHDELLLTELVYRTFFSCENVVRFLLARRAFEHTGTADARAEMKRLALLERQNALDAVHIYRDAPWLDIAERTDGKFHPCADMIAAKVRWIDEYFGQ